MKYIIHWLQYGNFDVHFINKTAMGLKKKPHTAVMPKCNVPDYWLGLYASLSTTRRNHATITHAIPLLNNKQYTDICYSHPQSTIYMERVLIISDQFRLEKHNLKWITFKYEISTHKK